MGLENKINILFNKNLQEDDIKSVVEQTEKADCILYDLDNEKYASRLLSSYEKVSILYEGYKIPGEGGCLSASKDSSSFTISIYQHTHVTAALNLRVNWEHWERDFDECEEWIDFERYIRFLLTITQGIPIKAINIEYE